jgi:hypothetical protein
VDACWDTLSGGESTAFWVWIAPVNEATAPLTPETLPANWMDLRNQWEYTHAARAVLQLIGLGALVSSLLVEIPSEESRKQSEEVL